MRFRNTNVEGGEFGGNQRPTMIGRGVRSRLFVPLDSGRQFESVPLGESYPRLQTTEEDGSTTETSLRPSSEGQPEWEMPDPVSGVSDTRPPENVPMDVRLGGKDRPSTSSRTGVAQYTVTGTTTTHSLNVSSPTAANCAQVLSALLADLQSQGLVTKV